MKEIREKIKNYLKVWISKKGDDDDLVDTDIDRKTNDDESEEIYQIEEIKENNLQSDKPQTDERDKREHPEILKLFYIKKQEMMMTLLILISIWRKM